MNDVLGSALIERPGKTQKERDASRNVAIHREVYPFAAVTPLSPAPHIVYQTQGNRDFFRQPYARLKAAVWLFQTEADREKFLGVYMGETFDLPEGW